jgi:PKD repeat protein
MPGAAGTALVRAHHADRALDATDTATATQLQSAASIIYSHSASSAVPSIASRNDNRIYSSGTPTPTPTPLAMSSTNQSTGAPNSSSWNFGDDTNSIA